MPDNTSLRIESVSRGPVSYVRLFGTVDESFNPAKLLSAIEGRDVIANLKGITRFTSFGVREWVHAMEVLAQRTNRLLFVECSPAVVAQLNMVSNFVGLGSVVSVMVPHFCEKCSKDNIVIRDLSRSQPALGEEPTTPCPHCGAPSTMDEDPDTYFAFCRNTQAKPITPELIDFINDFSKATPTKDTKKLANENGAAAKDYSQTTDEPANISGSKIAFSWRSLSPTLKALILTAGFAIVALGIWKFSEYRRAATIEGYSSEIKNHIDKGEISAAETLLGNLAQKAVLSSEQVAAFSEMISDLRQRRQIEQSRQILKAFESKNYASVVKLFEQTPDLKPELAVDFAVAESLRLVNRLGEAQAFYQRVSSDPASGDKLDDALFWQAEASLLAGQTQLAADLFEKVLQISGSEFSRSASRRLDSFASPKPSSVPAAKPRSTSSRKKPKQKVDDLFNF